MGGIWLAQTHPVDRITQLTKWLLGGALVGVAVTLWVLFIISLEQVPAGEPIVLVLNDVGLFMAAGILLGYYATGLEAREQQLELSEQRFRALTENSSFAVITIDESSTIRYANDAVEDLFGYSPGLLTGEPLTTLMPDRLQEPHRDAMAQYLSAGERSPDWAGRELVGQRANGAEFPVEVSFGEYAVADEHLFTGVIQDVSDRKAAEHRLHQHTTKVTQLHEIATDITAADSRAAIHQRAADGAVELFGADVARVAVVEGDRLVPAASSSSEDIGDREPMPLSFGYAGQSYQTDTVLRVDDLADTRSTARSPIRDGGGESEPQPREDPRALLSIPLEGYGVLQVLASEPGAFTERDEDVAEMLATHVVTALDRVSAEATIRRERDRLEEFASLLSHDLRNPLNVAQVVWNSSR
ncbi:PAS domain S-box protein [Haloferax sp. ATB1]|uniref:PAS domain S-box protein n=1 Tax=Haloferax sp. ATB1 TaxID=1508454 RepID=UPI0018E326D6|nr:PAS domain S-box protein [Haloferax sp. ATB1]